MNNDYDMEALVRRLPMKLRRRLNTTALSRAFAEDYIRMENDGQHMLWLLGSKSLLAYFCGRMWCGDMAVYHRSSRTYLWNKGNGMFPEKDTAALFQENNLRSLRKNKFDAPWGFELVDELFE